MTLLILSLSFILLSLFMIRFLPEVRLWLLLRAKKPGEASKLLEQLLAKNPSQVNLYGKLGKIYFLQNRRDGRALKNFEIILKLQVPFQWRDEILPLVAMHYVSEGRRDWEAIQLLEKAVQKETTELAGFEQESEASVEQIG